MELAPGWTGGMSTSVFISHFTQPWYNRETSCPAPNSLGAPPSPGSVSAPPSPRRPGGGMGGAGMGLAGMCGAGGWESGGEVPLSVPTGGL